MDIERFDLERWQSIHEHAVEITLSESGVHPLRLRELVDVADLDGLLGQELGYTQTNGTVQLRERVAALYDGASAANVLVTNGGSEANFVTCWRLDLDARRAGRARRPLRPGTLSARGHRRRDRTAP